MKKQFLLLGSLVFASQLTFGEMNHASPPSNPDFDRMKTLVGHWQGVGAKDQKPVTVEYQLTSGGAALLEVLFPGTPHEMISIYYPEKKTVTMTHYCALGNRPTMNLVSTATNELNFTLAKKSGLTSPKETHMHALKIVFPEKDRMTQTWTLYSNGKEQEQSVFQFTRTP